MTRLFSILTTEADAGGGFVRFLPVIVIAICSAVLLICFIVGYNKGGKQVSWAGVVWLCAAVVYCFIQGLFGKAMSQGLHDTLANLAIKSGQTGQALTNLTDGLTSFIPAFIIAFIVIVIVMITYGILSIYLRPRVKMIEKNADSFTMDEDGVEYDQDYEDYDDYESYTTRKMPMRINCETPGFGTRLIGGFLCLINGLMVVGTILALFLFLLDATSLKDGALSALYEVKVGEFAPIPALVGFSYRYALDVFLIGIIIAFICKGRRTGLSGALCGFVKFFGLFAAFFCLYLPFSPWAVEGGPKLLYGLTTRCVNAGQSIFGAGALGWLAPIVGKLFAGLLLMIVVIVITVLLNWVLTKVATWSCENSVAKIIDGTAAAILYLFIGIAVCLLVWAFWYLLARYGIFNVQELFTEQSSLSSGLFKLMGGIIEPLLVTIDQMLGFVPAA